MKFKIGQIYYHYHEGICIILNIDHYINYYSKTYNCIMTFQHGSIFTHKLIYLGTNLSVVKLQYPEYFI